ncbi:MAG TPA: RluA family pseudouridine synthase [Candidatus Acidoferrales bacterium]|nr:RluA family pseudouridine synthase [Candidatus Acidoferrales bacterium]
MPTRTASFVVPLEARHQRLDHFLAAQLPALSRTRIQQLIREGHAVVDAKPMRRPGLCLRGGERLTLTLVERPALAAEPEPIPLEVLYEDDDLVAVNKPAGLTVHAGAGQSGGTLVNALLHRFGQLSSVGGPLRPGIVHRLDKPTSGVLLVAKNDQAHRRLAEQFSQRQVEKRYLALVHGRLPRPHDTISLPVARDLRRRTRMTTRRREGRAATTEYRVLATTGEFTLVEVFLHTGRTHQVRVHFSALGHPVVGDTLYGAPRRLRRGNSTEPTLNRNFLHAERIRFRHPHTNEVMEIRSPLPSELMRWLEKLGVKATGLD